MSPEIWNYSTWGTWGYEQRRLEQLAKERERDRMVTPFQVGFLGPSELEGYKQGVPAEEQPITVPVRFIEAMEVRNKVFVEEQGVAPENEFDWEDQFSCHWVAYQSIQKVVQEEVKDEAGNVVVPRKWETRRTPTGCIRLVPFPHEPHPKKGAKYVGGLTEEERRGETVSKPERTEIGYMYDRTTSVHDGQEPYLKLGRLAVIPEYRGTGTASLLVRAAVDWMCENPNKWDPSVKVKGLERLAALDGVIPKWMGLVCVHSQESAIKVWKKFGFEVDEGMGTWHEEGIPHVGMWLKVDFGRKPIYLLHDKVTTDIYPESETIF
ncbi:GNAT family N-acetyltransferase [Candidatus Bathyarchaeota archaeon]|nr:GNAT family N-acetyltransferase [Candidatus Bathyarchaeota archaeon]